MKAISFWFYSQSVKQDEIDQFVNMKNEWWWIIGSHNRNI
jgi:hypothetical protein